jgi:membrane protein implicated in regulation of membrane protease activity
VTLDTIGGAAGAWLIAALALGIAELLVPGVFLVFLAVAAAITGVATLALPDLSVAAQLGAFTLWSAVTVLIGRRWYVDYSPPSADPLLNHRASRMIGQVVTVEVPIRGGQGRVVVGDGAWPARGPEADAGEQVRITAVEGGVVEVERLEPAESA